MESRSLQVGEIFDDLLVEERAKSEFEFFVRDRRFLGLGPEVIGPRQLHWPQRAEVYKKYVKIAPRGHGKSVTLSQAYPLWRLYRDPGLRIVVGGETLGQAKKNLRGIKNFIERPFSPLHALKPDQTRKWGETEILVNRNTTDPHSSILAVGVGVSSLGSRTDIAILDDIVSDRNSATQAQREKIRDWFQLVVVPFLKPGGEIIIEGTLWHPDDFYHYLKDQDGYYYDDYETDCFINEAEHEVLWPEHWDYNSLMVRKKDMGSIAFTRQYRNDLSVWKDGFFKEDWIRYDPRSFDIWQISECHMGVDPSTGVEGGDYFAYVVSGLDKKKKNIHTLEAWHGRIEFPEQVAKIKEVARKYEEHNLRKINIESTAYQAVMAQHLKRTSWLPIVPCKAEGNKRPDSNENRFLRLTPFYESGRIYMKENQTDLLLELLQCPFGGHDDLLDALWYSMKDLIKGKGKIPWDKLSF